MVSKRSLSLKTIQQTNFILAKPNEVYDALINPSKIEFSLKAKRGGTELKMVQSKVPAEQWEDTDKVGLIITGTR
jgi:hypothetical protein